MAKKDTDVWTKPHVESLAPDDVSIPAALKVLKKGGFGTVEPTADGRGWWVVCQGLTDTYQVSVQRDGDAFDCRCNCFSSKNPCKHALALLLHLVDHPELRTEAEVPKTAATDFEPLLRVVFANPEEDTPRLIFADYLEENDQPDRAALIRYQCEQSRLKPQTARHKELKALLKPLVAKLDQQIGPLPDGMQYEFRRGFVRLAAHLNHFADIGAFPVRLTDLFRDGWIEALVTYIPFNLPADMLPLLAQVGELDVSSFSLNDERLLGLAADTAAARATGRLARVNVHSSNRKAFAGVMRVQQGESLDLSADLAPVRAYNNLDAQTFHQLLQFGRLSGARDLYLDSFGDLGAAEVTALLTADLSDLRHLRLRDWKFTRAAMEELANSPALAKLATLSLESCRIQSPSVTAVVRSPLFATLKTLVLSGNNIGKLGVAALLKVDVPPKLQRLVLTDYRLDAADRRRLKKKFGTKLRV